MNTGHAKEEWDPIDAQAQDYFKEAESWRTKWFLSLAVGNGALAAGVASRFEDAVKYPSLWFVFLPALWISAIGLLTAGAIPWAWTRRLGHQSRAGWALARCKERSPDAEVTIDGVTTTPQEIMDKAYKARRLYGTIALVLEIGATVMFFVAAVWILTTLTFIPIPPSPGGH